MVDYFACDAYNLLSNRIQHTLDTALVEQFTFSIPLLHKEILFVTLCILTTMTASYFIQFS